MRIREQDINTFLQSRGLCVFALLLMFAATYLQKSGTSVAADSINGTLLEYDNQGGWLWKIVAATAVVAGGGAVILLNKANTFISSLTSLYTTFFLLATTALPFTTAGINASILVMPVSVVCAMLLFASYEKRYSTSEIYLIFAILSAFTLAERAFYPQILLFIVGVIQMRIMSVRMLLAIAMGVITPYWIVLGFGLAGLNDFSLPSYHPIFRQTAADIFSKDFIIIALISLASIATVFANVFGLLKFKLQIRIYNGFILMQFLTALAMTLIDFEYFRHYALLIAGTSSIFMAQFFAMNEFSRKYLAIITLILLFTSAIVWQTV